MTAEPSSPPTGVVPITREVAEKVAQLQNLAPASAGGFLVCRRVDGSSAAVFGAAMEPAERPEWIRWMISAEPVDADHVLAKLNLEADPAG